MPITTACCCLCGRAVIDDGGDPPWMARFYAIYSLNEDLNTWRLSGPGQRLQLQDRVDAGDGTTGDSLMISLNPLVFRSRSTLPPQPDSSPEACGYPFHVACWDLLSASGSTEPSDIHLVANLCRSTPIQSGLMNWGHDYGGLVDIWAHDIGGIREAQTPPTPGEEPQLVSFPASLNCGPDPWDIPELARVFSLPTALPTAVTSNNGILPAQKRIAEDKDESVFKRFPMEILSMILIYLPSRDVARLRLASRIFANSPLPDYFWRSRFWPQREFHHVFEAHQPSPLCRGNWKHIFDMVRNLETTEAVMERKRIWHLALSLHGLLHKLRDVPCQGIPIRSFFEPDAAPESDTPTWLTASRALQCQSESLSRIFSSGSRSLFERQLVLPPPEQTVAIFACVIDLFGQKYISGIRIVASNNTSLSLGYVHHVNEELVSQIDTQRSFTGFCLAQDQRGVRGLAMMSKDDYMSPWVGEHHDIPKRLLLTQNVGLEPVDALKGGFDATKLVSISIAWSREHHRQLDSSQSPPSLRSTTLWHPQIPDLSLRFLGTSGTFPECDPTQELPLCYTIFGGCSGEHVDSISGLTVRGEEDQGLLDVTVSFVGCEGAAHFGSNSVQPSKEWSLVIDGSRGERITGLDTFVHWTFTGFRIYTNFGRVANFPPDLAQKPVSEAFRSVRTEDTVVGFWGTMTTFRGLSDFGLVSINPSRSMEAPSAQNKDGTTRDTRPHETGAASCATIEDL